MAAVPSLALYRVEVPGDFLDVILIAVIAAFAVAGYRQGFIIGVLSLTGFIAGVAAGAFIAPGISRALAKSASWQAFLAILVVFGMAVVGMLIASGIGIAVRSRLTGRATTVVDSVGGAAVNIVAVVIVAWLIGSFVVNASAFPAIARQVNNSAVLRTIDKVMPQSALYLPVFPELRSLLNSGIYSPVFSAIGAESGVALPAPNPSLVSSAALERVEPSIVKVVGTATSCSQQIEGSGFVISAGHVLTNAHVVAGVDQDLHVYTKDDVPYRATVVFYDPQRDLAVLDVPGLTAEPLRFAVPATDGTSATVVGYPENHPLTVVAARIGQALTVGGPDIYQTGSVNRQIYPIRAQVLPGNSGGPLLSTAGEVYGVVFAASTYYQDVGYALTAAEVESDADAGMYKYSPVSTETCQGG
jgi:S1-C subfamily serine protease